MSRPTERDHRCTDLDLLLPLREQGYRSLQATATVLGVRYAVLRRVAHGQACTVAEEQQVRQAWARLSPDAIRELALIMVSRAEAGAALEPAYARQLRDALERVLRVAASD